MPRLALSLLGSFQAVVDEQPIVAFESDKARALLAFLAVESGRPHSRERLAGLLWPESTETLARASLSHALTNLRHAIRDAEPPLLLASRQSIQFSRESDAFVDVIAFEQQISDGRRSAADIGHLEAAVALYHGRFLEGFSLPGSSEFEEWLLLEQEHLHRLAMEALGRLAVAYEDQGELDRALAFAWRQLELDPWWESAHRQAMRLQARKGQRDAALAQYQACCRLLADELAAVPSPETVKLYEQIRDGQLPAQTAPWPEPEEPPSALPGFLTGRTPSAAARPVFVARDKELAGLEDWLAAALDGRGRVAFVVGGPGRGKTVLLHEFARRALDAHPDLLLAMGTCNAYSGAGDPYLPFRGALAMLTGDAEAPWAAGFLTAAQARRMWDALPDVAPVLSRRGSGLVGTLLPGRELLARARAAAPVGAGWLLPLERLRSTADRAGTAVADPRTGPFGSLEQSHLFEQYANVLIDLSAVHPVLLVLDDLQWVDLSSVGLLFHLGRRIERGRILITGAYRPHEVALGRDGQRHPLEPVLAELRQRFGDTWIDLAAADEAEGRTFVDRLLDTEPNALDEQFRGALFGQTRGHPLFTVELLRAMQQRGDLVLDEDGRWVKEGRLEWGALPARAEAAIAERLARLPEELYQVLAAASVEGEEFTAQAVALVQGMDELRLLRALRGELAGRHRLVREQGERIVDGRCLSRYRFAHFLFQQHLYQGLSEGERLLLHRRMGEALERLYAGHLEEVAVQLLRHFAGDPRQERRYARMAGERATAQFANDEAVHHLSRALELTPASECRERYELLMARVSAYLRLGKGDAEQRDLAELETLAEGLGAEEQAEVSAGKASYAGRYRDFSADLAAMQEAADRLARVNGQPSAQTRSHRLLGFLAEVRDSDTSRARAHYAEALALARAGGLRDLEALVLGDLGECRDDPKEALSYYEPALLIAREVGDRQGECVALRDVCKARFQDGDLAGSWTGFQQCLDLARQIGWRMFEQYALWDLGLVCYMVGDAARARGFYDLALRILREMKDRHRVAGLLRDRADAARALGDVAAAWEDAREARQLGLETGAPGPEGHGHMAVGNLYQDMGDPAAAQTCYAQALQALRRIGATQLHIEPLARLAGAELALGQIGPAQGHVGEILAYLDDGGCLIADCKPFWTYLTCYQVLVAAGNPRANEILSWAHTQLQEWAARCPDEETRRSFLENVPWHREILREWQLAQARAKSEA